MRETREREDPNLEVAKDQESGIEEEDATREIEDPDQESEIEEEDVTREREDPDQENDIEEEDVADLEVLREDIEAGNVTDDPREESSTKEERE